MLLVLKVNLLLKHDLSISFLADFEKCDSKMLSKIDFYLLRSFLGIFKFNWKLFPKIDLCDSSKDFGLLGIGREQCLCSHGQNITYF